MADLRIVDAPLLSTVKGTEKLPTGGEGNFSVSVNQVADFTKLKWVLATEGYVDNAVGNVQADLNLHKNDVNNPHQVTKVQVGLGNVDNTADLDKPVSNATQSAIITANSGKADKLDLKASKIDSDSGQTQQVINDFGGAKWYAKSGGYELGATVKLANGETAKSTIYGNANNPNVDMTGWFLENSDTVITVGSIEDIKILPVWDGRTVFVKSYLLGLNKGVGTFVWDSTSTLADNGGTVIQVTGVTTGRWIRQLESYVTPYMFGAKGDGVTDDTVSIQKAILFCKIRNKKLLISEGIYCITSTLDFGSLVVLGEGLTNTTSSRIKCIKDDILMAKVNSKGSIRHVFIDGNSKALWGVLFEGNRPSSEHVEVRFCKEYGFVFNNTQNATFSGLSAYFNGNSMLFCNAARNITLVSTHTSLGIAGSNSLATINSRELVFDVSYTNSKFGVSGITIINNGNDQITFVGGVSESVITGTNYIVESRNSNSCPVRDDGGKKYFYRYELTNGTGVDSVSGPVFGIFSGSFSSTYILSSCYLNWYQYSPLQGGLSYSKILSDKTTWFRGGSNVNLPFKGALLGDSDLFPMKALSLSDRSTLPGTMSSDAGTTWTYDSSSKKLSINPSSADRGLYISAIDIGNLSSGNTLGQLNSIALWRVTLNVVSITGGTQIEVGCQFPTSPIRDKKTTLTVGLHQILIDPKRSGGSAGGLYIGGTVGVTGIVVSNILWELI